MSIKLERAISLGKWHKGPVTTSAVIGRIPADVIKECPARLIAQVANAINQAYHDGRASTGAEMVDHNCVWINKLDRAIEWAEKDGQLVPRFAS